jgi:hypothetical protein
MASGVVGLRTRFPLQASRVGHSSTKLLYKKAALELACSFRAVEVANWATSAAPRTSKTGQGGLEGEFVGECKGRQEEKKKEKNQCARTLFGQD